MFSTLLGPLPPIDTAAGSTDPVADALVELEAVGLELLASGLPAIVPGPEAGSVVEAWTRAAEATALPVKQVLLGPYAGSRRSGVVGTADDLAERVAAAILALADGGCAFVEVEEPDLGRIVDSPAERQAFTDAHRRLFGVLGDPGVHCSLATGGGNLDAAGAATFFDLPYASFAFDLIDGPDNWRLIAAAPQDRGIICGALSSRPDGDETREVLVWAAHYAASTAGRGIDRVGLANAGSLAELPRDAALRKLRRVAEAARIAATGSPAEMASLLDSRAFGGRRGRPRAAVRLAGPDEE